MRTIKYIFVQIMMAWGLLSCGDDFEHEPLGNTGGSTIPGKITNITVRNTPGGAVIKYKIPDNVDLLYIKAVYQTSGGVEKDVKSSFYVDSLVIEGLGDTNERTILLYAVNRMERMSEATETVIKPETPPIILVEKSLSPAADFGGFVLNFTNPTKAEVSIAVMIKNKETGAFEPYETLYTKQPQGTFSVRGLPAEKLDFQAYVRDKWDNSSDTLSFSLTPWKEDYLLKSKFIYKYIAGDVTWSSYNGTPEQAFDDKLAYYNFAHTAFPVEFPHRYTLDLGVTAQLSRFKFYQRPGDDVLYQHGAPKKYRVYGRTDNPGTGNASNVLEGWTLLMECNSFKPSGLPMGVISSEDVEFAAKGEEFSFPREAVKVRYIRFEMLESWSGMKCSTIGELAFWGEIQN